MASLLLPILLFLGLCAAQLDLQHPLALKERPYLRNPPSLGFGTWRLDTRNASAAVSHAIHSGYRHIDAAAIYGNEKDVGAGIADGLKKAHLKRNEIWVTSKLWNSHHRPDLVPEALSKTLRDLKLSYLDLYHMHWPASFPPSSTSSKPEISYLPTWRAMISLLRTGKVRYIGVSNFSPAQLDALISETGVAPHVHQMELHPYLQQNDWIEYHEARGIHVTAYSPLGGTNPVYDPEGPGALLKTEAVGKVANETGCTPGQVVLSWGRGRVGSVIAKSSRKDRIEENRKGCGGLTRDHEDEINALGAEMWRYSNPSKSWGVELFEGLEGV